MKAAVIGLNKLQWMWGINEDKIIYSVVLIIESETHKTV